MKPSDGKELAVTTNHHQAQSLREMSLSITQEAATVMMLMQSLSLDLDQTLLAIVTTDGMFIILIMEMLILNGFIIHKIFMSLNSLY